MEEFDKHISSSIPAFNVLQESILSISRWFIKDNSIVLDFGCSTGSLLSKLHSINTKPSYIGFDISKELLTQIKVHEEIALICQDITEYEFRPPSFNLGLLIFTLQFLPLESRITLLKKLRSVMKPRSAILVAEKVYQESGFLEEVISMSHYDYKMKSFSAEEILLKQMELRKIMSPQTAYENAKMFANCGFEPTPIWQSLNFKAWILLLP